VNVLEIIKNRRNIKKFKSDMVDLKLVEEWLVAASMAPNHRMTEPWEIYFIGENTRGKLNHKTNFGNAPILMAILSMQGSTKVETEENAVATSCFIQNFNLAAWDAGVGSFWSSIGITPKNRELLGVPVDYDVIGVLGVGYPEVIPEPKPRTPIQTKIKYLP
jgi:nitroreductase